MDAIDWVKLEKEFKKLEDGLFVEFREIKSLLWELLQELKKLNTQ